jgi:molybdopterin molybdotransferase
VDGSYIARLTGEQGSHVMSSLVQANALVIVPEGVQEVRAGTQLDALMIDWPPAVF